MQLFFGRILSIILLILSLPLLLVLFLLVKMESPGPFIFKQKRIGKNKRVFTMYKIRTMVNNAEKIKEKLLSKNEADGPVFKIRNDPRFTRVGKWLSHTGFDELSQLVNVIKGEMALVGPRPLPIDEAEKVPYKYEKRFSVLPGITSLWIIRGAHQQSFDDWMQSDLEYVFHKSLFTDLYLLGSTFKKIILRI